MLDLGCGQGLYSRVLAQRGAKVIGVDLNMDTLRTAQKQRAGRCYFVCADAGHLPFRDVAFDMAVSVEVLSHSPPSPRRRILGAIAASLKDGGQAYITLHNRARLTLSRWLRLQRGQKVYATPGLDVWPQHPSAAERELACCGLRVVGSAKYLNYHSRFSYAFYKAHPRSARLLIILEDLLSRLPLLRRLAITYLLVVENDSRIGVSAENTQ